MFGALSVGGDKGEIDRGIHHRREFDLGFFSGFTQPLERHLVLQQIDIFGRAEVFDHPPDDFIIKVIPTQMIVTRGRFDFIDAIPELEDRHIKCPPTEIHHHDFLFGIGFIQAIS